MSSAFRCVATVEAVAAARNTVVVYAGDFDPAARLVESTGGLGTHREPETMSSVLSWPRPRLAVLVVQGQLPLRAKRDV
jgi:hypothetical protein